MPYNCFHSIKNNLQIQLKRHILGIPNIHRKFIFPRKRISAMHLCISGQARINIMTMTLLLRIPIEIFY